MRILLALLIVFSFSLEAAAGPPGGEAARTKFYDFGDMLINGEIKKPTSLYTDVRQKAKFDRLLKLKKSFMNKLMNTAREKVFK